MYQFEVVDAIAFYAKEKLGLNMNPHSFESRISLDVNEWKPQYQKHSNGKYVRDEKGHAILDESEGHWVQHSLKFGDMDTMSIYLWADEDDDKAVEATLGVA